MNGRDEALRGIYEQLTILILRAEGLERDGTDARQLWREISVLEEQAADALPPADLEGSIARRGAITAALSAGDAARAVVLARRYLAETGLHSDDYGQLVALRLEAGERLHSEKH